MKLKELKDFLNSFSEEYDDVEVYRHITPKLEFGHNTKVEPVIKISTMTRSGVWSKDTPINETSLFID